ncbi:OmpA family protein [Nocardiopsis dassonvillei]|uniref:OmpA family protein n=1 Tax=Nocardiopsis dassonvillei TaxID=2014 RepID=UPI0020A47941|nr:OmpA family protein [Nocardiopsis dassonvillei]MCP3017105.1 OmpA family protein [Nocardiopsis dassonvillei]
MTQIRRLSALLLAAAILLGIPYLLLWHLPWPELPDSWAVAAAHLRGWRLPPGVFTALLITVLWALWALYAAGLVVETFARLRGMPRRLRPLGPLQVVAAAAVGTVAVAPAAAFADTVTTQEDREADGEQDADAPPAPEEAPSAQPVERVRTVTGFGVGSAELTEQMRDDLAPVAEMIDSYGDTETPVRITGHTDPSGNAQTNQELSERRAQAVADHLDEVLGEEAPEMEVEGVGSEQPREGGAAAQRRAEVTYTVVPQPTSLQARVMAAETPDPGAGGGETAAAVEEDEPVEAAAAAAAAEAAEDGGNVLVVEIPDGAVTGAVAFAGLAGGYLLGKRGVRVPGVSLSLPRLPRAPRRLALTAPPPRPTPGDEIDERVTVELDHVPGLGITGPGAAGAARRLIVNALDRLNDDAVRVLLTEAEAARLVGDRGRDLLRAHPCEPVRMVGTTEEALTVLQRELHQIVEDGGERPHTPLALVTSPTSEHETALSGLLLHGQQQGITAVVLGRWPLGGSCVIEEDGLITETSPPLNPVFHCSWPGATAEEVMDAVRAYRHSSPALEETGDRAPIPEASRAAVEEEEESAQEFAEEEAGSFAEPFLGALGEQTAVETVETNEPVETAEPTESVDAAVSEEKDQTKAETVARTRRTKGARKARAADTSEEGFWDADVWNTDFWETDAPAAGKADAAQSEDELADAAPSVPEQAVAGWSGAEPTDAEWSGAEQAADLRFEAEPTDTARAGAASEVSARPDAWSDLSAVEQPANEEGGTRSSSSAPSVSGEAVAGSSAVEEAGPQPSAFEQLAAEEQVSRETVTGPSESARPAASAPAPEKAAATGESAPEQRAPEQSASEQTAPERSAQEEGAPVASASERPSAERYASELSAPAPSATREHGASEETAPEPAAPGGNTSAQAAAPARTEQPKENAPAEPAAQRPTPEEAVPDGPAAERPAPEWSEPAPARPAPGRPSTGTVPSVVASPARVQRPSQRTGPAPAEQEPTSEEEVAPVRKAAKRAVRSRLPKPSGTASAPAAQAAPSAPAAPAARSEQPALPDQPARPERARARAQSAATSGADPLTSRAERLERRSRAERRNTAAPAGAVAEHPVPDTEGGEPDGSQPSRPLLRKPKKAGRGRSWRPRDNS